MSDAEKAELPPAPAFLEPDIALERIQVLTATARNTWLLLIGFLAFIGITLLSVRDVDFFSIDATTELPIVNIAIPTATFFWTAALLAAVLHTYFHVFLLKLWDALAEAPPEIGKLKLGDQVFPWLVNDWALRRRGDRPVTKRPLDLLGSSVTALVIWGATPILLVGFWLRSLPAHDARLSLVIAAALWLSVFASLRSEGRARARLSRPGLGDWRHRDSPRGPLARLDRAVKGKALLSSSLALVVAVPLLTIVTIAGAGGHHLPAPFEETVARYWPETWGAVPIASANLVDAEIAIRPADWREPEIARRRFRVDWCADAGIPEHACEKPEHPDQELARQRWCGTLEIDDCAGRFREIDKAFAAEWQIEREAYIGIIRGPDLRNRDLRNAAAHGVFLAGVDLREARLEGADLGSGWLEGANLDSARLEGANLGSARLERANLSWAWLEGAYLSGAWLEGANLESARLERAGLAGAWLEGANLRSAGLERAILEGALLGGANLGSARLERANLRGAHLNGAYLGSARLEGANLEEAVLEGANLRGARLEGASLFGARLQSAEWAGARLGPTLAPSADFAGGNDLTQSQLAQVIGSNRTMLPRDAETGEPLQVWSCWEKEDADTFLALSYTGQDGISFQDATNWILGFVCRGDDQPRPVGTPAEDVAAETDEAD